MAVDDSDEPLRTWQLTANSTDYEHNIAVPSYKTIQHLWIALAVEYWMVTFYIGLVLYMVLSSHKLRQHPFNVYLLFLLLPDLVQALSNALLCTLLPMYTYGRYDLAQPWVCRLNTFYLGWYVTSNCWLNARIAMELLHLLRCSHRRQRYFPPTRINVMVNSMAVYLWSALLCALGPIPIPHFPSIQAQNGLYCKTIPQDQLGSIIYYIKFGLLGFVIPTVYVFYSMGNIYCHGLLPPPGKRRQLVLYFGRIAIVFIFFWVPLLPLAWFPKYNLLVLALPPFWSPLQGVVAATMTLMKNDVKKVAQEQWIQPLKQTMGSWLGCCSCCPSGTTESALPPTTTNNNPMSNSKSKQMLRGQSDEMELSASCVPPQQSLRITDRSESESTQPTTTTSSHFVDTMNEAKWFSRTSRTNESSRILDLSGSSDKMENRCNGMDDDLEGHTCDRVEKDSDHPDRDIQAVPSVLMAEHVSSTESRMVDTHDDNDNEEKQEDVVAVEPPPFRELTRKASPLPQLFRRASTLVVEGFTGRSATPDNYDDIVNDGDDAMEEVPAVCAL